MSSKRLIFALAAAAVLAASGAEAKIVTQPCTKDLRTGIFTFDTSKVSSDYVFNVVRFRETSRDSRVARGVCTVSYKYQPPD